MPEVPSQKRDEAVSVNPKATSLHERIEALETTISVSSELDTYMTHFESWISLTREFKELQRLEALKSVCKRGYPMEDHAQEATLRVLQCLIRHGWGPDEIVSWLSEPYVALPSLGTPSGSELLRQLNLSMTNRRQPTARMRTLPSSLALVYSRIAAPILSGDSLLDHNTSHILYRARWGHLIHSQPGPMTRVLKRIAVLLIDVDRSPDGIQSHTITDQLIDYLSRLVKSQHVSPSLLQQVSGLLPPSILSPTPKTAVGVTTAQLQGPTDCTAGPFLAEPSAATEYATAQETFDIRGYFCNLEFQYILDRAQDAHILPKWYDSVTKHMSKEERGELIHQIAHQYSVANCRRHRQNWRSICYLHSHLQRYDLLIKPSFSKAVVQVGLIAPLSTNSHVSSRKLAWILSLVASVEGERAAHEIQHIFWKWRGELIASAEKMSRQLGGPHKIYVNTLKNLGIT
jgi:hypothetical protein